MPRPSEPGQREYVSAHAWTDLPPQWRTRRRRAVTTLDLAITPIEELRGFSDTTVRSVFLAVPSLAHLRLLLPTARLLGTVDELVVRFTAEDRPRRAGDWSAVNRTLVRLRWTSPLSGAQVRMALQEPTALHELLGCLAGHDRGPLTRPLRVALQDRDAEPFFPGNPHVRYAGVNDAVDSGGRVLGIVDATAVLASSQRPAGHVQASPGAVPTIAISASPHGSAEGEPALSLPPVDTRVVNPLGFRARSRAGAAQLIWADGTGTATIVRKDGTLLAEIPDGEPLSSRHLSALRPVRFVAVDPSSSDNALGAARVLTQLGAAGVPMLAPRLSPRLEGFLGPRLAAELRATSEDILHDPLRREAASIRLRRAALLEHGTGARSRSIATAVGHPLLPAPSVSVLLVTKRPTFLRAALAQIAAQSWPRTEIVLGLHGDGFSAPDVAAAVAQVPIDVATVRIAGDVPYGEALNRGTEACSGSFITKWDDDDLYGTAHIADLLLALDYSGATLVGKGAEFVYLDELNLVVRKAGLRSERWVHWLAGGTLLLGRDTLRDLGGWSPVPWAVDFALLRQVTDHGGSIYRTHGFGYMLRRHGHGHTWEVGPDHFVTEDSDQWRPEASFQSLVLETDIPPAPVTPLSVARTAKPQTSKKRAARV